MSAILFQTPRLTIWLPGADRAAPMVDYLRRNCEHFEPTSPPQHDDFYHEVYWRERMEKEARAVDAGTMLPLTFSFRADEGRIIGNMSLTNLVRGPFQAAHLGYKIDRDHQGQGLMYEALQGLIRHAFESMALHRIMANYMPTNERSGRLLRRLGFVPEGYARDYLFLAGAWRDHVLTSLVNPAAKNPG